MTELIFQYSIPELILVFGIFSSLLFSVLKTKSSEIVNLSISLSVLLLVVFFIAKLPPNHLQTSWLSHNYFTIFLKVLSTVCFLGLMIVIKVHLDELELNVKEFSTLSLTTLLGNYLLISSNDLITTFLSLELLSMSIYVLCGMFYNFKNATEAAMKYILLGALSTCLFLFGIGLIYATTNSVFFADIDSTFNAYTEMPLIARLGCIFLLSSLLLKFSAAPFHFWAPDVFQGAPLTVVSILASLPKIAVYGIMVRLLAKPLDGFYSDIKPVLLFCGLLSIGWGTLGAIFQKNLRRLLGYSSIAHAGFILVPLAFLETKAFQASLAYLSVYMVTITAIFMILLKLKSLRYSLSEIKDLEGIHNASKFLSFLFACTFISLSGIPPMSGFFAKFYTISSIFESKNYVLAAYMFLMSVIGVFYYFRVIKEIYTTDLTPKSTFELTYYDYLTHIVTAIFVALAVGIFWLPAFYQAALKILSRAINSLFIS